MSETPAPGMDAETFDQFLEQLERYVRERLIPAEAEVIANDRIPDEIVAEMKEMGLFGLTVPEDFGGAGLNTTQYAKVVKTMAYAAPAYRSIFSINVGMFNSAIKNGGTDAQKAEWWPRIAEGEIACFGLTEPGSGSDSAAMATTARPDPGWQRLDPQRHQALHHQCAARRCRADHGAHRKGRAAQERACQRLHRRADGYARRVDRQPRTRRWASRAAISRTSCSTMCMCRAMRCSAARPARVSALR